MRLKKIVDLANDLADDQIPYDQVSEFVNDGIAAINADVDVDIPYLDGEEDEPRLAETWQRLLLVPYAKARIKEKDSSEFEWEVAYEQYFENLKLFKKYGEVEDDYKSEKRTEIVKMIDALSEDNLSQDDIISFINDGIAFINAQVNADFPFITKSNTNIDFPETWQRALLVPYAESRVRLRKEDPVNQKAAYQQFTSNLELFEKFYEIPPEYKQDKPSELVEHINTLSNNKMSSDDVISFINDAIAAINIEMSAELPFINSVSEEPELPESWQRTLIVPYAKARIKEREGVQFEWEVAYQQFNNNLNTFRYSYTIPKQYKSHDYSDLMKSINMVAQQKFHPDDILSFLNDGIAAVNAEMNAAFPYLEFSFEEPALPETWNRLLLVPYAKSRVKEVEGSLGEQQRYMGEYRDNLILFREHFEVPKEYKKGDRTSLSSKSILDFRPYLWGGW